MLVAGIDPMALRKAEGETRQREARARECEAENSFENIAHKWWEWWSVGKSPRHADYILRRLEADVLPAFGRQKERVRALVELFTFPREETAQAVKER